VSDVIPLDTDEELEEYGFWALPDAFFVVLLLGGWWLTWLL